MNSGRTSNRRLWQGRLDSRNFATLGPNGPQSYHALCFLLLLLSDFYWRHNTARAGTPAGGSVAWTKKSKPGYSPLAGEIPGHNATSPASRGSRSRRLAKDPEVKIGWGGRLETRSASSEPRLRQLFPAARRRLRPGADLAPAVWISNPGAPPAAIGTAATPAARSAAPRLAISGRRFHTEPASFLDRETALTSSDGGGFYPRVSEESSRACGDTLGRARSSRAAGRRGEPWRIGGHGTETAAGRSPSRTRNFRQQ